MIKVSSETLPVPRVTISPMRQTLHELPTFLRACLGSPAAILAHFVAISPRKVLNALGFQAGENLASPVRDLPR